jgi:aldehyde:ferredoxin oxidoreductase
MLSDEQITQFKMLYKKHFGEEISQEDARERGEKLIRLLKLVYKPMSKDEYEKLLHNKN